MKRATAMRQVLLCGGAIALVALSSSACSGGSTTSGGLGDGGTSGTSGASGTSGTASGGACGLSLGWRDNGTACNAWMDAHCCMQEKACANDSACAAFVSCADACPIPRKDACLNACGTSPPPGVSAIGACSKQTPPAVDSDIPMGCEWP